MNKKSYHRFLGQTNALLVIAIVLLLITVKTDTFGLITGLILILIFAYKSFSNFKFSTSVNEKDPVVGPLHDATTEEKISYYKKGVWIAIAAFTILSVWTIIDLNALKSGTEESVSLWGPIALLYQYGGYWLAVITTPLLGLLVVLNFLRKIKILHQLEGPVKNDI